MTLALQFTAAAKSLIYSHGVNIDIKTITTGAYNIETGTVTNTEVTTTVKAFPKMVAINSFNYPNLIGKTVEQFLVVAADLTTAPKAQDLIVRNNQTFTIEQVTEHTAGGSTIIYKLLAVKS